MKIFKKFLELAFNDWKKDYINKAEDLPDLERRMHHVENYEQQQAQIKLNTFRI